MNAACRGRPRLGFISLLLAFFISSSAANAANLVAAALVAQAAPECEALSCGFTHALRTMQSAETTKQARGIAGDLQIIERRQQ